MEIFGKTLREVNCILIIIIIIIIIIILIVKT